MTLQYSGTVSRGTKTKELRVPSRNVVASSGPPAALLVNVPFKYAALRRISFELVRLELLRSTSGSPLLILVAIILVDPAIGGQ